MSGLNLQPIRDRLAAATISPWYSPPERDTQYRDPRNVYIGETIGIVASAIFESDADLIANAPTDLAALLAEVERLRTTVKAVSDLHRPIPVYDECEHDADHGCDPIELYEYTGCSESQIGWGCEHCCYPNDWANEDCPHDGMHEGVTKDRACPTRIALDGGAE